MKGSGHNLRMLWNFLGRTKEDDEPQILIPRLGAQIRIWGFTNIKS